MLGRHRTRADLDRSSAAYSKLDRAGFADFLRFTKAHVFPFTWLCLAVPFLAAGGSVASFSFIALTVLAFAVHSVTYAHNAVSDYSYDRTHKNPGHSPLLSGILSYPVAARWTAVGILAVCLGMLALALAVSPASTSAIAFLFVWVVAGHVYNDFGLSKLTVWAWFTYAVCWTSAVYFAWFLVSPSVPVILHVLAAYFFIVLWYQISVLGRLKDIGSGEANELERMGARVKNGVFRPGGAATCYVHALAAALTVAGLVLIVTVHNPFALVAVPFLVGAWFFHVRLVAPGPWDRYRRLRNVAGVGLCLAFFPLVALSPLIGAIEVGVLLAVSVAVFATIVSYAWRFKEVGGKNYDD